MSTTFDVLPRRKVIPSYKEILELANVNINTFLSSIGIQREVTLIIDIQDITTHEKRAFNINDMFLCNETDYAWFYIKNTPGGTDCYFYKIRPIDRDIWKDEFRTNQNAQKNQDKIESCLNLGYRWSFRRSAGQPGTIVLSYGMLAASLAKLTDGLIYTDDGAWEYSMFPATADEFIECYLKPELAKNENTKVFAQDCIKLIQRELK